jgi:protein-L-isoaspartate(D-aspartate) O-methyltransferase
MDFEQARLNMIEQQIRTWEVLDQRVLDALLEVRREDYVPEQYRQLAFIDMEIPLGHGQVMMPPKLEARVLQALDLKKTDKLLEVGTGSGYLTALAAHFCGHVHTVEIVPELSLQAANRLRKYSVGNVALEIGDAARGWPKHGPYDAIVLTGSVPVLPETFAGSLKPGGRLIAIVGDLPVMSARLVTCASAGAYNSVDLFETCLAPLQNALEPERFVF